MLVKPKSDADVSKGLDLGKVLRSQKIQDLVVLNDEAHHIHDKSLAWFKNIEDLSHKFKLKTGKPLSLQTDYTATPKYSNGAIFVQTVSDFPLVEASFRTQKDPSLEFRSASHTYKKTGTYQVTVKVVDILGIDSSKMVEVRVG